jgi:hypothetical protein
MKKQYQNMQKKRKNQKTKNEHQQKHEHRAALVWGEREKAMLRLAPSTWSATHQTVSRAVGDQQADSLFLTDAGGTIGALPVRGPVGAGDTIGALPIEGPRSRVDTEVEAEREAGPGVPEAEGVGEARLQVAVAALGNSSGERPSASMDQGDSGELEGLVVWRQAVWELEKVFRIWLGYISRCPSQESWRWST